MNWTAMGPHWIIGLLEVINGKAYLYHGKDALLCPRNVAIFAPAHSLIQSDERTAEIFFRGNLFHGFPPLEMPTSAMMFVPDSWSLPAKADQVAKFYKESSKKLPIEVLKEPSYLAEKAKKFVDNNLRMDLKPAELAFKLKTNPAALSREFKTQSGLTLTEYHERQQATDAFFSKIPEGSALQGPTLNFGKLTPA